MSAVSPLFKYFGSKFTLSKKLSAPLKYPIIEPFAGSAGYSITHGAFKHVILNDVKEEVIVLWEYLRDVSDAELLALPCESLVEGSSILDLDLPMGAKYLIRSFQRVGVSDCWTVSSWGNAELVQQAGYSSSLGETGFWSETRKRKLVESRKAIQKWEFRCGDYQDLPDLDATWIIDPPYVGKYASLYKTPAIDYSSLAKWCTSRRGQVLVHENEGADWLPFEKLTESMNKNTNGDTGSKPDEVYYCQIDGEQKHLAYFGEEGLLSPFDF
jgi:site-specific DNA-adenine methylase